MFIGEKIHGREITEEFGMVSASAVRSKSVFNDLYVAIAGLFGGFISSTNSNESAKCVD
jgi:uncharacterized protein YbjQ (UPF0145 family)